VAESVVDGRFVVPIEEVKTTLRLEEDQRLVGRESLRIDGSQSRANAAAEKEQIAKLAAETRMEQERMQKLEE